MNKANKLKLQKVTNKFLRDISRLGVRTIEHDGFGFLHMWLHFNNTMKKICLDETGRDEHVVKLTNQTIKELKCKKSIVS